MLEFETQVEKNMLKFGIMPKKSVLVGLSGGADSVALSSVLCALSEKYGFAVYAAHINHMLRGDAAYHDETFAREFAKTLGIELFSERVDIRRAAEEEKVSEELAGRNARYAFFDAVMSQNGIECTATAHHKNDNAETVIMNFMRGSGIGGLCGIPARRGNIIRPFISRSRCEIESYCKEKGLQFVTDATNFENDYTRNRVRNSLIEQIERDFNPNISDTLFTNSRIISDENDFMEIVAEREYARIVDGDTADIEELLKLHNAVARRIIRKMLAQVRGLTDVGANIIESILELCKNGKTGKSICVADDLRAAVSYGKLVIGRQMQKIPEFEYTVKIGESVYIKEIDRTFFVAEADAKNCGSGECFSVPEGTDEIVITNRRRGDVFCPIGMKGSKKVKEYMIDEKIPRDMRDSIAIVRIGGEIAWLVGLRRDRRFSFSGKGIKIW